MEDKKIETEQDFTNEDLKTMVSLLNSLMKKGYTENFKVTERGLKGLENKKIYSQSDIKKVNFYRFEGSSDPADNSILYAIETKDGTHGTLADAYGAYANPDIAEFMKRVDVVDKKV